MGFLDLLGFYEEFLWSSWIWAFSSDSSGDPYLLPLAFTELAMAYCCEGTISGAKASTQAATVLDRPPAAFSKNRALSLVPGGVESCA